MSIYDKVRTLISALGWVDASIYAMNRCCQAAGGYFGITRYVLVAQPVLQNSLLPSNRGGSIVVRELHAVEDLGPDAPLAPALFAARKARGSICLGAFDRTRLVGYLYLTVGAHNDEAVFARFVPLPHRSAVWDYDLFILPKHRAGVVYLRIWEEVFKFLRKRSIAWSISYIASFNIRSMKSQFRLGAVLVGHFIVIEFGRRQVILLARRPFVAVGHESGRRPEIRVIAPERKDI